MQPQIGIFCDANNASFFLMILYCASGGKTPVLSFISGTGSGISIHYNIKLVVLSTYEVNLTTTDSTPAEAKAGLFEGSRRRLSSCAASGSTTDQTGQAS